MIKILVCCHKPCILPQDDIYLPIQVGKERSRVEMGIQTDNSLNNYSCDNISILNNIYCEMTAMYWAWKNIRKLYSDISYIGLCHYRRFFDANNIENSDRIRYYLEKVKSIVKLIFRNAVGFCVYDPLTVINNFEDDNFRKSTDLLKRLVPQYDVIYTKPVKCYNANMYIYFSIIGQEYIKILKYIITCEYKQYENAFRTVLESNYLYAANMLILKIDYLDEYCDFVFGVLEKHLKYVKENSVCIDPGNEKIYSRVSGYLAELLTSTYITYIKDKRRCVGLGKIFVNDQ